MAQKNTREGLQNVKKVPLFCPHFQNAFFVLLLLLARVTKGDDDPKERRKRKRRRRRRAFLCRRRPHRESAKRFDISSLFLCVRSRLEFLFQNTTIFSIERRPIKARAAKTTTKADAKTTLRDERTNERNEEQQQQQKCPRKRNSSGPG